MTTQGVQKLREIILWYSSHIRQGRTLSAVGKVDARAFMEMARERSDFGDLEDEIETIREKLSEEEGDERDE